jgi:hypothetical protein
VRGEDRPARGQLREGPVPRAPGPPDKPFPQPARLKGQETSQLVNMARTVKEAPRGKSGEAGAQLV